MKANRAKSKVKLSDTQQIDLLLKKIDLHSEFADEVQSKIKDDSSPKNNDDYIQKIPLLKSLSTLSNNKKVSFESFGSRNKEMIWRLRQFIQNKNNQFNPTLLSLINTRISIKNNRIDQWSYRNINDEIKLNINPSLLVTGYVPEMFLLKSFIPLYIEQLSKITKTKYLINTNELLKMFLQDAKLVQWKEDVSLTKYNINIIKEFIGNFNTLDEALMKILFNGVICKWKNKNKTFIDKASIKLLEHVERLFVHELYNYVLQ